MFFINHSSTKLARTLVCALVVSALAAPAAAVAMPGDYRSPDTVTPIVVSQDMRSPDSQSGVVAAQDLRSPDAVTPAVTGEQGSALPSSDESGFDWATAGIVVAITAALGILAFAAVSATRAGGRRVARP